MTVPVLAFFNAKGGVGKTSLVYHMAWMYAELGWKVVAVDLDPQAELTARFVGEDLSEDLGEDLIGELQEGASKQRTMADAIAPLLRGAGELLPVDTLALAPQLHLIAGSLELSSYEDTFSSEWMHCVAGEARAFHVTTALRRVIQRAAAELSADVALVDLGPFLGAINRAALIASDHIVIPLGADASSLRSLRTVGAVLQRWRDEWSVRVTKNPAPERSLPAGTLAPAGYVVLQPILRMDRPIGTHARNMARIPSVYAKAILGHDQAAPSVDADPSCLGVVRRYGSLMQLSEEARRPIFQLKASDGAIGAHAKAVLDARRDFEVLARRIAAASWLPSEGRAGSTEAPASDR